MNNRQGLIVCIVIVLLAACSPAASDTLPPTGAAAVSTATLPPVPEPPATSVPGAAPTPVADTGMPTATIVEKEPVNVTAFCTTIGKDVKTYVPADTPVVITWGWSATTEKLIADFLDNNITVVTLDGKPLAGTMVEGIQKNQTSGEPEVVWYEKVGVLEPGTHIVTYDIQFKQMIEDGHSSYGPGGQIESGHDQCEIIIEATGAPTGNGEKKTRPADGMAMRYVPAGSFIMGAEVFDVEKPIHEVTLDAFWIDQTEVTNAMFEKFAQATRYQTDAEKAGASRLLNSEKNGFTPVAGVSWRHPFGPGTNLDGIAQHPVVHVSWNDAAAYCDWAGGRLPTEAEWEKASRAEDGRTYPWGEALPDETRLNGIDEYLKKSANGGYPFSTAVGSYPAGASPYGAFDLAGNAWEWVTDWFGPYPGNPIPDEHYGEKYRVLRGGSWFNPDNYQRSSYRYIAEPSLSSVTVGFRCASAP